MNDNFNTRMILTTAVFAAVAALLVGPASAKVMDVEDGGGNGSATAVTPQPDPLAEKGPIPYFSHGIGVDQSLWGGQVSLGLTGDSPTTRVVGQEPAGLTGDSPRTRGQVFQANTTLASTVPALLHTFPVCVPVSNASL